MQKMTDISVLQKQGLLLLKAIDSICKEENITYVLGYGSTLGAVRHKGFIPWDADIDILIPYPEIEKFRNAMDSRLPSNMEILRWDSTPKYHPCFDRITLKDHNHSELHVDVYPLCGLPDDENERIKFVKKCQNVYRFFHCKYQDVNYSHKNSKPLIYLIKVLLKLYPNQLIQKNYKYFQKKYDYNSSDMVYAMGSCSGIKDIVNKMDVLDTIEVPFEDMLVPIPRKYDDYLTHLYGDYMTPVKY